MSAKAWWRSQKWLGTVVEVHDGDTLTVEIDRGFDDFSKRRVRLRGCNARELSMPGGPEAAHHLREMAPVGTNVVVQNTDWDKYGGRIVGDVTGIGGIDLAAVMVEDGYAAPWDGQGPKRVPPWPIPTSRPPTHVLVDRHSPDWPS